MYVWTLYIKQKRYAYVYIYIRIIRIYKHTKTWLELNVLVSYFTIIHPKFFSRIASWWPIVLGVPLLFQYLHPLKINMDTKKWWFLKMHQFSLALYWLCLRHTKEGLLSIYLASWNSPSWWNAAWTFGFGKGPFRFSKHFVSPTFTIPIPSCMVYLPTFGGFVWF